MIEVVVGRVGRAYGLRGEVYVAVRTDEPEQRFTAGSTLRTDRELHAALTVRSTRWQGPRLVMAFDQVADRSAAEALRGALLLTDIPADARPADPEEYYDHQLVGLTVERPDGTRVGAVTEVLHLPAQDVLVVHTDPGDDVLVPFVSAVVPVVDLASGHVTLDDPPGLLEQDAAHRRS